MILVYSGNITSRLRFALNLIFGEVLDYAYRITDNYDLFLRSEAIKVSYSEKKTENIFYISPSGLMEEKGIREQTIETGRWKNIPVLFANSNPHIPFDIFSAIFYLTTRYEEYLSFYPDKHHRFEADQSIAWKNGFLHLPVVDLWCKEFAKELGIEKECKGIGISNYRFQLTIDIDQAWYYKNKGFLHNTGSMVKKIVKSDISALKRQISVLTGFEKDPADTFNYLAAVKEKLSERIKCFILAGKRGNFDPNISTKNKCFQKLIVELEKQYIVGIHPSYASNNSFGTLMKEYLHLSEIVNRKIIISRQHFLKLHFPETYRNLIKLGINEDFSMGYGSQNGFRAGISRPFYFYDLKSEEQTNLRIVPFQVMDRTLLTYLKYNPCKAINEYEYYTKTIKDVGGLFVGLWHNTSLGDYGEWKGWRAVFEEMIKYNTIQY